jgi:hypothetical protein
MVCLLCVGSFIGDAAPAVIPHLRLGTVIPRNPRFRHSGKHTASFFGQRCAHYEGSHKV